MLSWDWSIRLGDIMTLGSALIVAGGVLYKRGSNDRRLEDAVTRALGEIAELRSELKKFSDTMSKIAVHEVQIVLLMKWYDELRHGVGLILKPEDG